MTLEQDKVSALDITPIAVAVIVLAVFAVLLGRNT